MDGWGRGFRTSSSSSGLGRMTFSGSASDLSSSGFDSDFSSFRGSRMGADFGGFPRSQRVSKINIETSGCETQYSSRNIQPGDKFDVTVVEAKDDWPGTMGSSLMDFPKFMYIGVTALSPEQRESSIRTEPKLCRNTWCLWTLTGDRWADRREIGVCQEWRDKVGSRYNLKEDDMVSVKLHKDRSLSIICNYTEIPRVFTDLPNTQLWVVVYTDVTKIQFTYNGKQGTSVKSTPVSPRPVLKSRVTQRAESPVSQLQVPGVSKQSAPSPVAARKSLHEKKLESSDEESDDDSAGDDVEKTDSDASSIGLGSDDETEEEEEEIPTGEASIETQRLIWEKFEREENPEFNVKPSKKEFYKKYQKKMMQGKLKAYPMVNACKGKACIISLPTYEVDWLNPLLGYNTDKTRLSHLWDQMGFDVFIPSVAEERSLTAEEINVAVKEFSEMLEDRDEMAVLCVLSHGGAGFIYGCDGKRARMNKLARWLDNRNCKALADKPKLVIIQACQGSGLDDGTKLETDEPIAIAAAADDVRLPSISDMVTCFPSMPGYISFVKPKDGSIFVKTLVDVLADGSYKEHLADLLVETNDRVADQSVKFRKEMGAPLTEQKQMPHYQSCLRKKVYMLPTPGGKGGKDWLDY